MSNLDASGCDAVALSEASLGEVRLSTLSGKVRPIMSAWHIKTCRERQASESSMSMSSHRVVEWTANRPRLCDLPKATWRTQLDFILAWFCSSMTWRLCCSVSAVCPTRDRERRSSGIPSSASGTVCDLGRFRCVRLEQTILPSSDLAGRGG